MVFFSRGGGGPKDFSPFFCPETIKTSANVLKKSSKHKKKVTFDNFWKKCLKSSKTRVRGGGGGVQTCLEKKHILVYFFLSSL